MGLRLHAGPCLTELSLVAAPLRQWVQRAHEVEALDERALVRWAELLAEVHDRGCGPRAPRPGSR